MDFTCRSRSAAQSEPDLAVGFLMGLEEGGELLPALAVGGGQDLLVPDLRQLDDEVELQPVVLTWQEEPCSSLPSWVVVAEVAA